MRLDYDFLDTFNRANVAKASKAAMNDQLAKAWSTPAFVGSENPILSAYANSADDSRLSNVVV